MTAASPPWQLSNCPFCRRLVTYPTGATLLLCPACKRLIPLSHYLPTTTSAQTCCASCRCIMLHPLGTRLVVCPLCTATNPASLLFYICAGCGLYLVYSSTLSMVVCAVCYTIHPPIAPPDRVIRLRPLQQGVIRPMPRLPPRRISWLPATPAQPMTGARSSQTSRLGRRSVVRLHSPQVPEGDVLPQPEEQAAPPQHGDETTGPAVPAPTTTSTSQQDSSASTTQAVKPYHESGHAPKD